MPERHGDEALPYNFVVGSERQPGYSTRMQGLEDAFKAAWVATCPDFQVKQGYKSKPGEANPTLATNWIYFAC